MRIAVGIPVYNDSIFLERSVKNCIDMGYDHVVYLNDGSTDGTYEKLMSLTKEHSHIKVLNGKSNSVFSGSGNRWEIVAEECRLFNPDWIMTRAADETLSYPSQKLLKDNLIELDSRGINMIIFDYKDLWRSEWWYRVDSYWGKHQNVCLWKNDTGWKFNYGSGIHLGGHRPNYMSVKDVICNININPSDEIVVIHYGMSSHELLARKLDYQINTSLKIEGRAAGMPSKIPPVRVWGQVNGYKAASEQGIVLEKVRQSWFKDPIPDESRPQIKSLYDVVAKYDLNRAEEYVRIYGR